MTACTRPLQPNSFIVGVIALAALGMLGIRSSSGEDVFALISEKNGNLNKLNITTGTVSVIKSNGTGYLGLAYGAGETTLYGIAFSTFGSPGSLVTIDQATGASTLVGANGVALTTITSLADGRLFGVGFNDSLYQISPATGAASLIGPTGLPNLPTFSFWDNSLASDGTSLYYTLDMNGGSTSLYALNLTTGNAVLRGNTGTTGIFGSAFAGPTFASGQLYGFRTNGQTVTISLTTGTAAPLNTNGIADITGGVGFINTVPEPASFALLAFASIPLLLRRRVMTARA